MKHILLFITIIGFCAGSSDAQLNVWRWQNPLPEGDFLHAVQMVSLDVIYACGENSTFMRTSDGGQTWDIQSNIGGSNKNFYALNFFDQNYGMCCGDSGKIIKTTDGGSTWKLLNSTTTVKLSSILVVDKNIALAITLGDGTIHGSGILRTTDGGNSWGTLPIEGNYALFSIRMLRPDFLTVTGYGGTLMKSIDTGRTWQNIKTPYGNTYFSALFTDEMTATVIGDQGLVINTTNGGVLWNQQLTGSPSITASLNVVDGKDPNVLSIVGDYGTIIYTSDAGATWKKSDIGTLDDIKGISFFDKMNGTAVGKDGVVLRTTDGGQDWFFLPHIPYTDILYSVAFPKGDTSLGLTCGFYGTILRTTNGGQSWEVVPSGTGHTLRGICFMDSASAIAVGDYGTIIKTTDAGLTWSPQPSGTMDHLYAVSFATPNDGLVVGDSNMVLRTYTAGEFWTHEFVRTPSPGTSQNIEYFRSVTYPDKNHAFMIGSRAWYESIDGGINWKYNWLAANDSEAITIVTSQIGYHILTGISFADSLHGALIGGFGRDIGDSSDFVFWFALFTSNGGATWDDSIPTPTNVPLNAVEYIDSRHATVVGNGGYIGHTANGGTTFNQQTSNTANNLFGVGFGTIKAGTAVGWRGNIMRITTDETNEAVRNQSPSGVPKIIIDGNYPNPFSRITTIAYHLPTSGFTTVEIFSIDGKQIAILTNEFQISGEHNIRFEAANLSSGTYICRVSSNGMSAEGKMKIEN